MKTTVTIPDDLWQAARTRAGQNPTDRSLSGIVCRALDYYLQPLQGRYGVNDPTPEFDRPIYAPPTKVALPLTETYADRLEAASHFELASHVLDTNVVPRIKTDKMLFDKIGKPNGNATSLTGTTWDAAAVSQALRRAKAKTSADQKALMKKKGGMEALGISKPLARRAPPSRKAPRSSKLRITRRGPRKAR